MSRLRGSKTRGRFLWRSALRAIQRNRPHVLLPGYDLKALTKAFLRILKKATVSVNLNCPHVLLPGYDLKALTKAFLRISKKRLFQ